MDFSLDIVDEILVENIFDTESYHEFVLAINSINDLYNETNELILEEYIEPGKKLKNTGKNIVTNTIDTTKKMASTYDNTTTALGNKYKAEFDLVYTLIHSASKVFNFILNTFSKLMNFINKYLQKLLNLPDNIKNKIKGNIKLYITKDDLEVIYNKGILQNIQSFLSYALELSQGETWRIAGLRQQVKNKITGKEFSLNDDAEYIKNMTKSFNYISKVKFTQSVIEMKNADLVDIYFSKKKILEVSDFEVKDGNISYKGKVSLSYAEGLNFIVQKLFERRDTLKLINEAMNQKISKSEANSSFTKLNDRQRKTVMESIKMISKTTAIIGEMIKNITSDINTIQKEYDVIIRNINLKDDDIKNGKVPKGKGKRNIGTNLADVNEEMHKKNTDLQNQGYERKFIKIKSKDQDGNTVLKRQWGWFNKKTKDFISDEDIKYNELDIPVNLPIPKENKNENIPHYRDGDGVATVIN